MKINPYGIVAIGPDLDFNQPHGRNWCPSRTLQCLHLFLKLIAYLTNSFSEAITMYITVKPVLSGHHFKRTPSIKRTQTPKKYMKWSFLLLPTCIKRTLVIKFHHPTCQTQEMWKIALNCHLQIFRFLHLKTWLDELIWFDSPYCIVFYFVLFV